MTHHNQPFIKATLIHSIQGKKEKKVGPLSNPKYCLVMCLAKHRSCSTWCFQKHNLQKSLRSSHSTQGLNLQALGETEERNTLFVSVPYCQLLDWSKPDNGKVIEWVKGTGIKFSAWWTANIARLRNLKDCTLCHVKTQKYIKSREQGYICCMWRVKLDISGKKAVWSEIEKEKLSMP